MQFHELKSSRLCVGIDPHFSNLHPFLESELKKGGVNEFLSKWSCAVIDATAGCASSVKFQSAFYEAHGSEGFAALKKSCDYARARDLFVILDAKRGDISSTMTAYGEAAFDFFGADCLTISPYVGTDVLQALKPWLAKDRCVYSLLMTSNESANMVQSGFSQKVFEIFESFAKDENLYSALGYVVGATKISDFEIACDRPISFLMPGVGAQGAKVDTVFKDFLKKNPASLVPISRGISQFPKNVPVVSWSSFSLECEKAARSFEILLRD